MIVNERVRVRRGPFMSSSQALNSYVPIAQATMGKVGKLLKYDAKYLSWFVEMEEPFFDPVILGPYHLAWFQEDWLEQLATSAPPIGLAWVNLPSRVGPLDKVVVGDGREFDGFCDGCGGLRVHRLMCPRRKRA